MTKENPEEKYHLKHIIPAEIPEESIAEHLRSALIVAGHNGKSIKIIREITKDGEKLPSIEIVIHPNSSADGILQTYQQERKSLALDGTVKNINISSPKHDINRNDPTRG